MDFGKKKEAERKKEEEKAKKAGEKAQVDLKFAEIKEDLLKSIALFASEGD